MARKLIGLYNYRELSKRYTKEQIAKAIYEDVVKKIKHIKNNERNN